MNDVEPPGALTRMRHTGSNSRIAIAIYVAMILLTFSVAATHFFLDYRAVTAESEQRARAYAVSMATDVRWYLEVARQALKRIESRGAGLYQAAAPVDGFGSVIDDLPDGVTIVIYDAAGRSTSFLNSERDAVDISDRRYFHQLKAGADTVISNLIADRVTGEFTFAVGQALRSNGEFLGAAIAYAPMQVFASTWLSVGGRDSNAFLVHADGWLTARLPPVATEVYDAPLPDDFVAPYFSEAAGAYSAEASPIDGIRRVVGFARVPGAPLSAAIGISTEETMRGYWTKVIATLLVLLPIAALLGFAGFRNSRLIDAQERTAAQLAASLERNELLFLEIHHRVKNNLQSVLSLIRLHSKSPDPVAEIQPRVQAMVAVHEHIYRTDSFATVSAPDYIASIARQIIEATSQPVDLKTDIVHVDLPNAIVMPLGQLICEAVINALKYGFPDGRSGTISIRMTRDDTGQATLVIHDDGEPLPEDLAEGMGTRLIRAFAAQLNGDVTRTSDQTGVKVEARFPLEG